MSTTDAERELRSLVEGLRTGTMDRRRFLQGVAGVTASLAAASTVTACSGGGGDSSGGAKEGTLSFYFGASPEEAKTRKKVIAAFEQKFPKIKIKTQVAGTDPLQQLLTSCAGGKCPDVMMSWELLYPGLAKRGVYADLNEFLDKDKAYTSKLKADSSDLLLKTFQYQGKQVGLPEQFAGVFLYYNKKLFEQAGLEPPPAKWTDSSWTFDKFLAAAQKLTKKGANGKTKQYGFVDAWDVNLSSAVFGMNNGVEWFQPPIKPTKTNGDDPNFVEGLQFYADLFAKHGVAPNPALKTNATTSLDLFTSGRAGMVLTGHWMYSTFAAKKGLDFDVCVLPVGPNGGTPKSDIGTTGLAVAASSKNRDAAWEFVKFSCGPEGQKVIADSGLFIPVLKSLANSEDFKKAHPNIENFDVFLGGLSNAHWLPISAAWGKIQPLWNRDLNQVLQGKQTAAKFAATVTPQIQQLLRTDG